MNNDILGRGCTFPMGVNLRGGIKQSNQTQKVRESIFIILSTQQGERLMRPTFGSKLNSLVFAPNNIATANLARHYVETSLTTWEPRIDLNEIIVENDNRHGRLLIHIHYTIKATLEPQNLVYPFYLEPRG